MIKNFWSKISYYWFIGMLIIIGLLTGNLYVKADTLTISSAQYNVYVDSNVANGCTSGEGQGYKNLDVVSDLRTYTSSVSTISAISRIDYTAQTSSTYNAGVTYNLEVIQSYNPKDFSTWSPSSWTYSFEGSTSTSTSGLNTANINSFSCYIEDISNNNYQIKLHCIFEPKVNLKLIFFRVVTGCHTTQISYFNTYTLKVESVTGTEGAINNQTNIIQNNFNETNNNINNINDTLNDDTIDSPSDMLEDFEDLLPSNGVITQLLALPITWYQKILNSLSGTCQSFNLGSLYGTNLIMPCIELSDYLGSTLVNTIDLMITGFFILHIARKMIKAFENFTSMKEGDVIND